MGGEHRQEWELAAFSCGDVEAVDDYASVAEHVRGCDTCAASVDWFRQSWAAFGDVQVHEFADRPAPAPRAERIADARNLIERAVAENDTAEVTFHELMRHPIAEWPSYVAARPDLRTEALIRRIVAAARAEYDRDAAYALDLLATAGAIAGSLGDSVAAGDQLAMLAKERANALRMLSRYHEALDQLDWAERYLADLPVRVFDLAVVLWGRASVLFTMTRYAEALSYARRAKKIIGDFRDEERLRQIEVLEASIMAELGDVRSAIAQFHELLAFFDARESLMDVARVSANLADCYVRVDDVPQAHAYAQRASRLYVQLGMSAESVRVEFVLGHSLLRQGRLDAAIERLHVAAGGFEERGMRSEAGEALLDVVEAHIRRGAWNEAITLARRLAALFSEIGAPISAAAACAHLRDAVEAQNATIDLIEYVRGYIGGGDVAAAFVPPR